MQLIWFCEGYSTYNNDLFNFLGNDPRFELRVVYRRSSSKTYYYGSKDLMAYASQVVDSNLKVLAGNLKNIIRNNDAWYVFGGLKGLSVKTCFLIVNLLQRKYIYWNDTLPERYLCGKNGVIRMLFLRLVFRNARQILGTGSVAIARMIEWGCPPNKAKSFPYWIKLPDHYRDFSKNLRRERFTLITISRLISGKRVELVIEALKILTDKGITDIYLKIVGEGTQKATLIEKVAEASLNHRISFCGWKEKDELEQIYINSDAFIHMSEFEPYGVVILEAMARGCVVIASDKTMAALDRIENGKNGFIVKDEIELSGVIEELRMKPELCNRIGKNARITAEQWPLSRAVDMVVGIIQ